MMNVVSRTALQQRKRTTSLPLRQMLQKRISAIVVAPSFMAVVIVVYGFILWTLYVSMTDSRMMPSYRFIGLEQYVRLWQNPRWIIAASNMMAFTFFYVACSLVLGLVLAILLDQRIRAEGVLRAIYLYPMAISFIVAGTAWKWMLNPGLGLEKLMHDLGWATFQFDWIVDRDMAIYTLVIAAVWQSSGFVMALFLAGLRGFDQEIVKAAYLDGASTAHIYLRIIVPSLKPVFFSAVVILVHLSIKSFDLVVAMTAGGPGIASDLPAKFMFSMIFEKNQLGVGAASAIMMLSVVAAVIVPYLYSELREAKDV